MAVERDEQERREAACERVLALAFAISAAGLFVAFDGAAADLATLALLSVICGILARVEFEVGEGCTTPVILAVAPMLVLLPPGAVPVAVALGHVLAAFTARGRARRLPVAVTNAWYSLGPALVVGALGIPATWDTVALVALTAMVAQFALDFVVSAVRVRIASDVAVRELLAPFAWVWLVDALLLPLGVAVAAAAHHTVAVVLCVVPLGALLAVFARERTGRIENAMALQRLAEEAGERLQSIVANASDLIAIVRRDGTIAQLTGSVETVFGDAAADAEGTRLVDHVHPEDIELLNAFLAAIALKAPGQPQEAEWRLHHHDGSWRHVSAVATNLLDDPRVGGIVLTARDVDARKAFEEQLRHRAFHDALTSLPNRGLFYDRIEQALARAERNDAYAAVLYVDLDGFKPVNDSYGHAMGDAVLVEVASRLALCTRGADTAARLGGDEFGLLLDSVTGPNDPVRTAERIIAVLSQPYVIDDQAIRLTASVGIALSERDGRGVDELLRRADLAMYAAKRNGRNRIELYDAGFERLDGAGTPGQASWFSSADEQRQEIVSMLERDDAFSMAFQPIMDLRTGTVAGYEALARFNDVAKRPPNVWFAQAHRCGLGHELEAKAIAAALAVRDRPAGSYLTVNLSPSALTSPAVAAVLPERLDGIVIEITENEVITEDAEIFEALAAVRRRGARLAVDDTGSGYAGLTHVMRLEPDIIKLDRTVVAGVAGDPVKAALIESFVRYARDIGATVCAEGIEEAADLRRLADLDVAYGQGYGLARPGPAWATLEPAAVDVCRTAFTATLGGIALPQAGVHSHDERLERLTDDLARAVRTDDLPGALREAGVELHADALRLVTPVVELVHPASADVGEAPLPRDDAALRQTLAGDPGAELPPGFGSRLDVPVRRRGELVGVLEAYAVEERPWTRFEIRRARIIASSLGAALEQVAAA